MSEELEGTKYWINLLKQRMSEQGTEAKLEARELVEMQRVIKAAMSDESKRDADLTTLLELVKMYKNQQMRQEQQPQAQATITFKPDQLNQLKYQIMAYRHISKNVPVPAQILQGLANFKSPSEDPEPASTSTNTNENNSDPYAFVKNNSLSSFGRVLVPSVMPTGIDPIALAQERERRIRNKVAFRIKELEELSAQLSTESDTKPKIKALLELKALRLLEKQKRMRAEVVSGMKGASVLQTAVSRADYRRLKKPSLREIRHTEKMEKQHRMEREKKEKAKQMEYLNTIIQHGRDLIAERRGLALKQNKLGRAILQWHSDTEKEEQRRRERISRERINALKRDDEEAYLALLDQQKDTRITHLLQQTGQYLNALTSLVAAQQEDIGRSSGSTGNQSAPLPQTDQPDEDGDRTDYYSIAHRTQEVINEQPSILVGGKLKEYQIKGLEWMVSLYNNRLNGILADEMGLGKTIQTISLICHLIEKKQQNGPFLVIVPLSTITNWSLEFEKWAPSVAKVVYKGTPTQRRNIQLTEMRHNTFNVMLTTYEYIIKDKAVLSKIKWIYTIIDEGHRMKNASSKLSVTLCQNYSSRYRLILTGTPLQNNLPELWALLNFVLPKIFNSVKTFDEWFNSPFQNTGEKVELNDEEQLLIIKRLHKVLRPFLLRRLKKDVESDLPDKTERILKTPLSAIQQKLYSQVRKSGAMMVASGDKKPGVKSINNTIMQLRKICNHPYVFPEVEDAINPNSVTDFNIARVSGKFELLDRLLPKLKATGHRVLIFFQMTAVMDIMEDFLRWKSYHYLRLDGSTKTEDRSEMLKLFNDPQSEYFVFILSTRAGGLGLNLQSADTVIIFDSDWNPHQDLQAQDRAHRIGQTKEVKIFRLITANSVEETILARAQYKLDLDGKIIQAGKFDNKSTNEERDSFLRSLFEQDPEDMNDINDVDDDEELNEIIARGDDELQKFREMDRERQIVDQENWRALGRSGECQRLMTVDELPEIYLNDIVPEQKPVLSAVELGKGQRSKKEVRYDDGLTEDQFLRAVDNDMDLDEVIERKRQTQKTRRKRGVDDDSSSVTSSTVKRTKQDLLSATDRMKLQQVMDSCLNSLLDCRSGEDDRSRSELFLTLPSRKQYPDYYQQIQNPIAIDMIQIKIDSHDYQSVQEFKADIDLMLANAMQYNQEGSIVYEDAQELSRVFAEEFERNCPNGNLE